MEIIFGKIANLNIKLNHPLNFFKSRINFPFHEDNYNIDINIKLYIYLSDAHMEK